MKILELEISELRGVRHLELKPDGENLVIWGPNGSGKSAVIDAVDFLFTGRMRRLIGEGTAGITLKKHGPHIDAGGKESFVRAIVKFSDDSTPIEIVRRLPKNILEALPPASGEAEVALEIASRGQNILTRREILKFITADAGTRAEQIQALLDLVTVETTRKAFAQVENKCRELMGAANAALTQARSRLALVIGKKDPSTEDVLEFINTQRNTLGVDPLSKPDIDELKKGISSPDSSLPTGYNRTVFENHIGTLANHVSEEGREDAAKLVGKLVEQLRGLDADARRRLRTKSLVTTGLELLEQSKGCPLCETAWDKTLLREQLEARREELDALSGYLQTASAAGQKLAQHLSFTLTALNEVNNLLQKLPTMPKNSRFLFGLRDSLIEHMKVLERPMEESIEGFDGNQINALYASPGLKAAVEASKGAIESFYGRPSERVQAWDALTILEEAMRSSTVADLTVRKSSEAHRRARVLSEAYRETRDLVLQELYDSIKARFIELYKALHTPDESSFDADILPKGGAGIDFVVDFYGRGTHPPHALHSEGHQDSMGLCLFLALLERLSDNRMNLVLLDDVVMSVDADHRRRVGKILRSMFPDVQFIVTTHDRTWANQLRAEKVVTSGNTVRFYDWNLETGPRVLYEGDLWEQIEGSLEKADLSAASHRLRRRAEEYFQSVCDALRTRVRFSLSGRLELGDFAPAAMSRLKELLKAGKQAANSWNDQQVRTSLEELESTSSQVFARTQIEQWAINETVHYNAWDTLSAREFKPVVEAFQDLFDLFRCSDCGTLLRLDMSGQLESAVRCDCGEVSWNLKQKS